VLSIFFGGRLLLFFLFWEIIVILLFRLKFYFKFVWLQHRALYFFEDDFFVYSFEVVFCMISCCTLTYFCPYSSFINISCAIVSECQYECQLPVFRVRVSSSSARSGNTSCLTSWWMSSLPPHPAANAYCLVCCWWLMPVLCWINFYSVLAYWLCNRGIAVCEVFIEKNIFSTVSF
jgi:hypothetical protein